MEEQVLSRPTTEAGLCLMVAFFAVAGYNALEIFFSIFEIFKRRRGLYFWSMLAATLGIPLNVTFSITSIFTLIPVIPSVIGYLLGYYLMSVFPLIAFTLGYTLLSQILEGFAGSYMEFSPSPLL